MDLKQGGWSIHDYSKLFNHLTQYVLDQVDTDDKNKHRFMIGLSTKLQKRMTLNTRGSFPEFVSNVIIVNDAMHAHKDTKKRKAVAAPSGGAPQVSDGAPPWSPPTCLISSSSTSASSHSGFPAHLRASMNRWHLGLYLHHHPCRACLRHRPPKPPPAIPASTVAARPLHARVPHAQEESCSGPRHPSTMWSAEGGYCHDRPHQLHHYGRHSRGQASPRGYVCFK
jgi:hypothetical protein